MNSPESLIDKLRKHAGRPANKTQDYVSWANIEKIVREHEAPEHDPQCGKAYGEMRYYCSEECLKGATS